MSSSPKTSGEESFTEQKLKTAVENHIRNLYESDETDEITVKRVRRAIESKLGLSDNFLKSSSWSDKSKFYIEDVASKLEENYSTRAIGTPPPTKSVKAKSPKTETFDDEKSENKMKQKNNKELSKKQSPTSNASRTSKNIKSQKSADFIDDSDEDQHIKKKRKVIESSDSEIESDMESISEPKSKSKSKSKSKPKPTSKPKLKTSKVKSKQPSKPKSMESSKSIETNPEDEELKDLQRWLLKCGIRKFWHRELEPYQTHREKVKYLKGLLSDVGMKGKYTVSKAQSIKETRELQADLEEVVAYEKIHGVSDDDNTRTSRRNPLADIGWNTEDEDEESD